MTPMAHHQRSHDVDRGLLPHGTTSAIGPVCGMTVDPDAAKHRHMRDGQTYYFCSANCREKFVAEPAMYLKIEKTAAGVGVPTETIYTCPMHPEIRQEGPGTCPICGMALEPETATAEGRPIASSPT
jgi:P-type Cu+ transporter